VSVGEGLFHDVCADEDPAAHIRSMADDALRKLITYLVGLNQQKGIAGEVWARCISEATRRFLEGGRK
jgi:hypothetical protein